MHQRLLVVARLLSFAVFAAIWMFYGGMLPFQYMAGGIDRADLAIWLAMTLAVVVFFRWPWLAAAVSWCELLRAVQLVRIREVASLDGVLYHLGPSLLLLVASHAGLMSTLLLLRARRLAQSQRSSGENT